MVQFDHWKIYKVCLILSSLLLEQRSVTLVSTMVYCEKSTVKQKKKLVPVSKSTLHQMTWCSAWCSCFCIQCHDTCVIWYQITQANDKDFWTESRYTYSTQHKWLHAWSQGPHLGNLESQQQDKLLSVVSYYPCTLQIF